MAVEIKWARSATRHRISRQRSKHVALNPAVTFVEPAPDGSSQQDERIVFLGADEDGVLLEVMAVQTTEALVIIHAMTIRAKYRAHLPGAPP